MDNSKHILVSKTMWVAALTAIAPLIPGIGPVIAAWITSNPALFTAGMGAVFGGLRVVTNGKVTVVN